MNSQLRVGIIGLDTSHVIGLANLLNDPQHEDFIPGARITTGYPGGSPDFEKSASRIEGFTRKLKDEFGVAIVETPEAVAEQCDAILLTSVDGRVHLEQFSRIAPLGKPTFIDKPFAVSSQHARQISELAEKNQVPLMSSSPLRYAEALTAALTGCSHENITGADFTGPMPIEPTQPGFFWYGVHAAEALFKVMGPGCAEVRVTTTENHDLAVGHWRDGRIGTIRGFRGSGYYFGGVLHTDNGIVFLDLDSGEKAKHVHLTNSIIEFFRTGKSPIAVAETVEVIRFLEAANESRQTGETVPL